MQHLKPKQHYIDRYDLITIEKCLHYYWGLTNGYRKKRNEKAFEKFTQEQFDHEVNKVASYTTNVIKIESYRRKASVIAEWMERDRRMQDLFDNAVPPQDVHCTGCFSETTVISKDLFDAYEKNARVVFMFACVKCNKRQALYEDGTEWRHDPPRCPKCHSPVENTMKHTKHTLKITSTCTQCEYTETDVHDFRKFQKEREAQEAKDKQLLAQYRKEFCYDDEVGPKAIQNLDDIVRLVDEWKKQEVKEKDPVYQKAKLLKQTTVAQLKELLTKAIIPEGYTDLQFDKPEMGKYVVVNFSVNETNADRKDYQSTSKLQKLIKKTLEQTNWRLMTEGTRYRLGILTGRLKAYEHEDDLMELVKEKP